MDGYYMVQLEHLLPYVQFIAPFFGNESTPEIPKKLQEIDGEEVRKLIFVTA